MGRDLEIMPCRLLVFGLSLILFILWSFFSIYLYFLLSYWHKICLVVLVPCAIFFDFSLFDSFVVVGSSI